jgi:hypothetical protein
MHAETCSSCCDTRKSLPSDRCKAALSQCFREAAEKKDWGCPCCLSCFDTLGTWNQHMIVHQIHNEKVQNWSFSIMVHSLLHRGLAAVYHRYDWQYCSWASLRKNERQTLRPALERHVLPSNVCDHEDFAHLGLPESLALHAFQLGTVGNIYANATSVNRSQSAVAAVPCYDSGSSDQCSVFPPPVLDSYERDEQQCIPNTLTSELADDEELESVDCFPLPYQSAFGTTKWRYYSDHGPLPESQTNPVTQGTYIQSSQNRTGKARIKRKITQRIQRRTLANRQLLAK